MDAVARYQRDHVGAVGDETAIIELSAHHAISVDVQVDRTAQVMSVLIPFSAALDKCTWTGLQNNPNAGGFPTQPLWSNASNAGLGARVHSY